MDVDALRSLARETRPRLITIGGSLNLFPHPVATIREIADAVGAHVLFDAAHLCGMIAGRTWPQPLSEGAHLITMSTYKSLGGPRAASSSPPTPDSPNISTRSPTPASPPTSTPARPRPSP
nr:hypothetical protein GCM10020093_047750 [Planobispora longispora]